MARESGAEPEGDANGPRNGGWSNPTTNPTAAPSARSSATDGWHPTALKSPVGVTPRDRHGRDGTGKRPPTGDGAAREPRPRQAEGDSRAPGRGEPAPCRATADPARGEARTAARPQPRSKAAEPLDEAAELRTSVPVKWSEPWPAWRAASGVSRQARVKLEARPDSIGSTRAKRHSGRGGTPPRARSRAESHRGVRLGREG
jgi:hypothetical protein